MKFPYLLAGALGLSGSLQAADELPQIIVSATRVPAHSIDTAASIQVIDRDEISESGAQNLADLLRGHAGVRINDLFGDGSNATIDMRGFGATANSNVLVMVDGRKLNPASDMATLQLNGIRLGDIERIEIVQGSSGVLFGNQAVGGVINIITRGVSETLQADVTLGAGSYDGRSIEGRIGQRLDNGLGFQLSARHRESDNYRDHNQYRIDNINLKLDYQAAAGNYFIEHQFTDEWMQTPGALFADELAENRRQSAPDYATDFFDTRSDITRLGMTQQLSGIWGMSAEASHRDDGRHFVQSYRGMPGSLVTQDRRIKTLNPRLTADFASTYGETRLVLGADWEQTDYQIDGWILQTADQAIVAYYGQLTHPFAPGWDLAIGARHARVDNDLRHDATTLTLDDSVTVGSLGVTYRPQRAWRLFLRADQNYRFAKLDEHTNDVPANTFPNFIPQGLKNQTGISYELGSEYQAGGTRLFAQLYRLALKNEISYASDMWSNINIDATLRKGLMLSAEHQLTPQLTLGVDFDLLDSKITSGPFDGHRIPLVAEQQIRLFGKWTPTADLILSGEILHVGDQVVGSDFYNTVERLKAHSVANLNAQYSVEAWELSATLNNLLNKKYSETANSSWSGVGYFPAPERNLWLSARYNFQ